MSVTTHNFIFIQRIFIKKFNYLLKKAGVNGFLDPEGACRGLSVLFMHYSQQGNQAEFIKFLQAIQQLKKEEIIRITNGESVYINGEEYDQSKIIAFTDKIRLVKFPDDYGLFQRSFKKLFGANWDNAISFMANLENVKNLQKKLKLSIPRAGTYYVTFLGHAGCVLADNDGTYTYFDSNKFNTSKNAKLSIKKLAEKMAKTGEGIINNLNLPNSKLIVNVDDISFKRGDESIAEAGFKYVVKELGNMENFPNHFKYRVYQIFKQTETGNIPSLAALRNIRKIISELNENGIKSYNYLQKEITRFIEYYVSTENLIGLKLTEKNPLFSEKQKEKYANLLFAAILTSDIDTVQFLLDKGINPNVTEKGGDTALHMAVNNNDYEIVKLLISYHNLQINQKSNANLTAFDQAIQLGHTKIIQLLLTEKRLEKKVNIDLSEPLKNYIKKKNMKMVDLLLSLGTLLHPPEGSKSAVSPLQIALQYNNKLAVKSLLKAGINVKMENGRVQSLMAVSKIEEKYLSLNVKNLNYYFINAILGVNKKLAKLVEVVRKNDTVDDLEEYQKHFEELFQKVPKFLRRLTNLTRYREELQDEIIFNKASEVIRELEKKNIESNKGYLPLKGEFDPISEDLGSLLNTKLKEAGLLRNNQRKGKLNKSDDFDTSNF